MIIRRHKETQAKQEEVIVTSPAPKKEQPKKQAPKKQEEPKENE